jgi:hypothetical protein
MFDKLSAPHRFTFPPHGGIRIADSKSLKPLSQRGGKMRFPATRFNKFISQSAVTAIAIALFTMTAATGSASAATCTNASLKGVYGFFSQGCVNSEPLANLGQITASGTGTLTGTITRTLDGVQQNASVSGSYTLAKTCTGTITYTQGSATYNFAIHLNDSNIRRFSRSRPIWALLSTDLCSPWTRPHAV